MYTIAYPGLERNAFLPKNKTTPAGVVLWMKLFFCNRLLLAKQLLDVCDEILPVGDGCDDERQRRDQNICGADDPEPGPVLSLTGKLAYRHGLKEVRRKDRQEVADDIVFTRAPDVRGVFEVDGQEIIFIPQREEAQLPLEHLIEYNKQHYQQQAGGCPNNGLVAGFVQPQGCHQERHGKDHPVVIVEADDVQILGRLAVALGDRLLLLRFTIESGNSDRFVQDNSLKLLDISDCSSMTMLPSGMSSFKELIRRRCYKLQFASDT